MTFVALNFKEILTRLVQPRVGVIRQIQTSTLKTYFQYLKPFSAAEGTD